MQLEMNFSASTCVCWAIAGGSGVPPGTRPETCKRCKGSGVVGNLKKRRYLFWKILAGFSLSSQIDIFLIHFRITCKLAYSGWRVRATLVRELEKLCRYDAKFLLFFVDIMYRAFLYDLILVLDYKIFLPARKFVHVMLCECVFS